MFILACFQYIFFFWSYITFIFFFPKDSTYLSIISFAFIYFVWLELNMQSIYKINCIKHEWIGIWNEIFLIFSTSRVFSNCYASINCLCPQSTVYWNIVSRIAKWRLGTNEISLTNQDRDGKNLLYVGCVHTYSICRLVIIT